MKLFFEKVGNGEPLILLHGMFGSFENLGAIARVLQNHYTLYRVDLRNHGRSPHADTMSFREMADDVRELMDDQKIESSYVVGHSLGGKVAMQLAFDHPGKIKKIAVLDIAPVTYPSHHNAILDALKNINPQSAKSRKEVDEKLKNYVEELGVRQFILKNLERTETGEFFWRLNVDAVINCYDSLRDSIESSDASSGSSSKIEVLFLKGEKSNYIHKRNHEEIFKKFPNAKIEVIAGASHWLHAEDPKSVSSKIIDFLESEKN
ncbi:MAG: alpha/beta fold hydrolase [Cellvibrionaceae bacterium]